MEKRIAALRATAKTLRRIATYPAPSVSTANAQRVLDSYARSYGRALGTFAQRCTRLADRWERALRHAASELPTEMQMSFNLQYLQLQNQMQNENRQFTMVSNIMKTKHDTIANSIDNIR